TSTPGPREAAAVSCAPCSRRPRRRSRPRRPRAPPARRSADRKPLLSSTRRPRQPLTDRRTGSVAVVLDARGAQPRQAVALDRALPRQELVDGQLVALARFLEAQQASAHGRDDLCLAPDHPALGVLGRKIGDGQRAAIRPDDVAYPRPVLLFGH